MSSQFVATNATWNSTVLTLGSAIQTSGFLHIIKIISKTINVGRVEPKRDLKIFMNKNRLKILTLYPGHSGEKKAIKRVNIPFKYGKSSDSKPIKENRQKICI